MWGPLPGTVPLPGPRSSAFGRQTLTPDRRWGDGGFAGATLTCRTAIDFHCRYTCSVERALILETTPIASMVGG